MGIITTSFVKQFGSTLNMLAQQKGSRLSPCVQVETGAFGEEEYFDQYGKDTAKVKVARNVDVEYAADDYERRRVSFTDVYWSKLIDKEDKLAMLIDPTSGLMQAGAWAIGRKIDDMIIAAFSGTAYTGKAGGTSTTFTAANQIAVGAAGLTIGKLISAKELIDAADVDPEEERFIAVSARQITNLLNTTEVTSADFNTVKALVEGKIDTFMGFKFVRTQRIDLTTTTRKCLAWARSGMVLAKRNEMVAKLDQIPTKHYATQLYASISCGATRMEEEKCVEIGCLES
jgi:hypothetical protein